MERKREDLAWVAGFFDGEGCITPRKYHPKSGGPSTYYAQMCTVQNSLEVLEKCKRVTGIGHISGPQQKLFLKGKTRYQWQANGFEQIQALLAMMWEWLGTKKREQAIRVLALHGQKVKL